MFYKLNKLYEKVFSLEYSREMAVILLLCVGSKCAKRTIYAVTLLYPSSHILPSSCMVSFNLNLSTFEVISTQLMN